MMLDENLYSIQQTFAHTYAISWPQKPAWMFFYCLGKGGYETVITWVSTPLTSKLTTCGRLDLEQTGTSITPYCMKPAPFIPTLNNTPDSQVEPHWPAAHHCHQKIS
jgi:hypothetical protein